MGNEYQISSHESFTHDSLDSLGLGGTRNLDGAQVPTQSVSATDDCRRRGSSERDAPARPETAYPKQGALQ